VEGSRGYTIRGCNCLQRIAWTLFLSKQEKCLIVDTKDYHPGLLFLSRQDLARMIEVLSG
jgi:hypothetical protein